MPIGSVVLTPGSSYAVPGAIDLSDQAATETNPSGATAKSAMSDWTARVALSITAAAPAAPLLLVLTGSAAAQAPHLGFAQRSARRAVSGYVLVDPVLPRPGVVSDLPDAPVTVIVTALADEDTRSAALGARLRGWQVLEGDASALIAELARLP